MAAVRDAHDAPGDLDASEAHALAEAHDGLCDDLDESDVSGAPGVALVAYTLDLGEPFVHYDLEL